MFKGQSLKFKILGIRVSVIETITHCTKLLTRHTLGLKKGLSNLVSCFSLGLSFPCLPPMEDEAAR